MANKINFITGEQYNLSEIFSGERSIIVPDLQRDYCWGNDNNKKSNGTTGNLVVDFVEGLIEQYSQGASESINLGLVYGYEIPADHIQICDGQQRLTTLFLLLGMLNKITGRFRRYLISDFEFKHDDKEPYLSYAIRESTLYFLSDLVCSFFTSADSRVENIRSASWYFNDYDFDPSIRSMISALGQIERILDNHDNEWAFSFGEWLLHNVTILYFDMESRRNGEETFVVINTTGEPLTSSQNLKPLVISSNVSKATPQPDVKWEEMETWFWKNRAKGRNDTADAGFAEFLRWVYMIEQYDKPVSEKMRSKETEIKYQIQLILQGKGRTMFPYKEIGIGTIYRYWQALKWLFSGAEGLEFKEEWLSPGVNKDVQGLNAIGQNECFVLLPLLRYVYEKLESLESGNRSERLNVKRLYEFLRNIMRLSNATKAVNNLVVDAIKIAEVLLDDGDIVSLLNHKSEISSTILTAEEVKKLELLDTFTDRESRERLEKLIWNVQSHSLWNGEILPLIDFATDTDGVFDESKFAQYGHLIDEVLFTDGMEHEPKANLLRRCMIVASDNYRPVQRGYYHSFGWEWSDWRQLLAREENKDCLIGFFNHILNSECYNKGNINAALEEYLSFGLGNKPDLDFAEFAKDDYLLSFTNRSYACDMLYDKNDWQICTTGGTRHHTSFFSRRNAYILRQLGGLHNNTDPDSAVKLQNNDKWGVWYWIADANTSCVVVQCPEIKIDIRYLSDNGIAEFELKQVDGNYDLTGIIKGTGLFETKKGSNNDHRYIFELHQQSFDPEEIKDKVVEIVTKIDNLQL